MAVHFDYPKFNTLLPVEKIIIRLCVQRTADKVDNLDRLDLSMTLEACHEKCPLDFGKLLLAPDYEFFHDISGILDFTDRTTGELKDNFLPKCAEPQPAFAGDES